MCRDMGVGPGWDGGRCSLNGPDGLFLHCRVSMILSESAVALFLGGNLDKVYIVSEVNVCLSIL